MMMMDSLTCWAEVRVDDWMIKGVRLCQQTTTNRHHTKDLTIRMSYLISCRSWTTGIQQVLKYFVLFIHRIILQDGGTKKLGAYSTTSCSTTTGMSFRYKFCYFIIRITCIINIIIIIGCFFYVYSTCIYSACYRRRPLWINHICTGKTRNKTYKSNLM